MILDYVLFEYMSVRDEKDNFAAFYDMEYRLRHYSMIKI
jgi:hypothetical protein